MESTSGWRRALSLSLRVSPFGSFNYLAKGTPLREVGHIKSSWRDRRNTYPFNEMMFFPFQESPPILYLLQNPESPWGSVGENCFSEKSMIFHFLFSEHASPTPRTSSFLYSSPSCVSATQLVCHMAKVHAGWKSKQQGLFLSASDSCQDLGFAAIVSLLKCNKIVLELSFESVSKLFY